MLEEIIKPDAKKLEKLRREMEKAEYDLEEALREKEQIEHQIRRVGNRIDHLKKGERDRRTHRLCVKGGVIESLIPGLKDIGEKDFYDLMEEIFNFPQVQEVIQEKLQQHSSEENENG